MSDDVRRCGNIFPVKKALKKAPKSTHNAFPGPGKATFLFGKPKAEQGGILYDPPDGGNNFPVKKALKKALKSAQKRPKHPIRVSQGLGIPLLPFLE